MQISIKLSYIDWNGQLFPKFPKCKLQFLYNISKMKLEVKLIFCMQISIKVSCRLISVLWASKFPTSWCYHYWWAWSNILKVLNVTNLQYLNWIRDGVHFLHAGKPLSFCKLGLSFLMKVARHVQSTQTRKLVIFLQYLKKKNIDEVYFLLADKQIKFPKVETNILVAFDQT